MVMSGAAQAVSGWELYRLEYHGVLMKKADWPDFAFVPMHMIRCLARTGRKAS